MPVYFRMGASLCQNWVLLCLHLSSGLRQKERGAEARVRRLTGETRHDKETRSKVDNGQRNTS